MTRPTSHTAGAGEPRYRYQKMSRRARRLAQEKDNKRLRANHAPHWHRGRQIGYSRAQMERLHRRLQAERRAALDAGSAP